MAIKNGNQGKSMHRRLFLSGMALLPVTARAQDAALPFFPVETVHSDADRYVETIDAIGTDWFATGSRPQDYLMGSAETADGQQPKTFYVRAKPDAKGRPDFGTWMQIHAPGPFLGKRVRFSARIKTEKVELAWIWMRVDPKDRFIQVNGRRVESAPALAFYNMADRPIRGTTDWKHYAVVLDVADTGARIAYGVGLAGRDGVAWMDSATLEVVDKDVPVSVMPRQRLSDY